MGKRLITDTQIAEAKKAADQKLAVYRDLKAQKSNAARRDKKKRDDRRKVLAGACALSLMQSDKDFAALFMARLGGFLTRPDERAIFPELTQRPEQPRE
jgi:hypothetical protein